MELMNHKRVQCLKCYKYDYFTQIRSLAVVTPRNKFKSSVMATSSLFVSLGHLVDHAPYVPFNWRGDNSNWSCKTPTSIQQPSVAAAAAYPSPPSMPQPLSRNQRRRRNKAAKNSTPQPPPPPPPPTPIYQPATFPEDFMPGYLGHWMNSYNPALAHAPPPRRRAVSSNNFNFEGNKEKWLRERGWGWTALLA